MTPEPAEDRRWSLVYGLRLVPSGSLKSLRAGEAILKDGSSSEVTLHVLEGSQDEVRAQLARSLDAFFELLGEQG